MTWFLINACVVLLLIWAISRKYGTLLNPIGFFGAFYLMAAVIGPILYKALDLFGNSSTASINYTSALSSVYFASIGSAFLFRSSPFKAAFSWMFGFIRPLKLTASGTGLSSLGMLGQFVVLFVLLMFASGVGLLWITNPREAYAGHRASAGVFWSLCQATLILTFICVIFRKAKTFSSLFLFATLFAAIASFLGSKGGMLVYFFVALFYAHFRIRPVRTRTVCFVGICILTVALAAQLYQRTATNLLDTLLYFDYFTNTVSLIDRFKDFGFRYGSVTLSNIWYFVPRAVYPDKPFVYALVIADDFLYPGAAEKGYTPGMMLWTQGYCDFGIVGVILSGLFTGFLSKGAYELFLERRDLQSLALFVQIGTIYSIELFCNAPLLIFFIWLTAQLIIIRTLSRLWPFPGFRLVLFRSQSTTSTVR